MDAPESPARPARLPRWLETLAALAIVATGLVPCARRIADPFERGFGGHQGAFFATASVNYERFGALRTRGYPAFALDGPSLGSDDLVSSRADPALYVYANHPPLVPLIAWLGARAFGPPGWSERWSDARPPEGLERATRIPFLVLRALALLALAWALRESYGARVALLALAISVALPVGLLYGARVNYENAALPLVCIAFGFYARWTKAARTRDLAATASALATGSAFTYAPLFFAAPLALHAAFTRKRRGVLAGALLVAAASAPLVVHVLVASPLVAGGRSLAGRAAILIEPLSSGARPFGEWVGTQAVHAVAAFGVVALAVACIGAVLALRELHAARSRNAARAPLALLFAAGAALYFVAFYRHTLEEQPMFWLAWAPAVAACAAIVLEALARRIVRGDRGLFALVLATAAIVLPSLRAADTAVQTDGPAPIELGRDLGSLTPVGSAIFVPDAESASFATAYYAWRAVAPARERADIEAFVARFPALAASTKFLAVRAHVAPTERDATALQFGAQRSALAANASWTLYPLR